MKRFHVSRALRLTLIGTVLLLSAACTSVEPQPLQVLPSPTATVVQPVADNDDARVMPVNAAEDVPATIAPTEETPVTQPTSTPQPEPTDEATATPLPIPTATATPLPTPDDATTMMYRFDSAETAGRWAIVNDGVMGGISQSTLALSEDGYVLFFGDVSLENNGGFASARSAVNEYGLTDETGVRLTARADGKTYRLQLYSVDEPRVSYEATFTPATETWEAVDIPFTEFVPSIRGRVVSNAAPLNPASIAGIGLMIRDYQDGPFQLEVAAIEAYR